jgi:hypothetical protein
MNILPFVFAVLLILSYGASASFQSRIESRRNQKAHLGLRKTELNFLRHSEAEHYKELPGIAVKIKKEKPAATRVRKQNESKPIPINPVCCRLNLYPLLDDGRNKHPNLYETAAKLLRTFYSTALFSSEKGFEYKLLDAIVCAGKSSLKEEFSLPIETLDLNDPQLQDIYYTSLKGTKKCSLGRKGYPPLIDYLKIERKDEPICLFEAHPHMLTVFFGQKTAKIVYETLHDGQKQSLELDAIIQISNDPQLAFIDPEVWKLLNFKRPTHASASRRTFVAEDAETGISLRKEIQLKSN